MTLEVLQFLRELLSRQTLNIGAPDYRETARRVDAALDQLDQCIEEASSE